MTQQTPAEMRAEAEAALKRLAPKRQKLMKQLRELDETETRPLVIHALRMEVSQRRIEAITGVSAHTSRAWLKKSQEG